MNAKEPTWGEAWRVGLRVWVEQAGQPLLGEGRAALLEQIDRCHSISEAARQLGISYRRAWSLVQETNAASAEPLVVAASGGPGGGGAQLTPLGRWAVTMYRTFHEQLLRNAAGLLQRVVSPANGTALHVAAAVSLEEVLGRLLTDFALRQPALRVRSVFGASDELADHLLAGAPADLFLSANSLALDRLAAAGRIDPGSRTTLTHNQLAAVALRDRHMAVSNAADLVEEAPRVALADAVCPLGSYTRDFLQSTGLFDALVPRALWVENSRAVLAAVRAELADVGLVYASDAMQAADCRQLFRVPTDVLAMRYEIAVCPGPHAAAAQQLVAFLTSSAAARRFRECGFTPGEA